MFRKYAAILRMKYVEMFAYQASTVAWMLGATIQPMITMTVWMNIYTDQADSFILYFSALVLVERMTGAWDAFEVEREIREGLFSYRIIRPYHHIHWAIAENIVYKILFLVMMVPVWLVLAIFVPAMRIHMSGGQWVLFIAAILVGAVIRFVYSYSFGLLSFWTTRVAGIYFLFESVSLFLSGRLAPLALMPPVIKEISMFMPYRYMIGFPIEIVTGTVQGSLAEGFLGGLVWAAVIGGILAFLWKAGLKKNSAVGG